MVHLFAAAGGGGPGRRPGGGFGRLGGEESWNWASNATVTVRCCTTCPEVALFLNDRPLAPARRAEAAQGFLTWSVPFESGVLKAVGRRNGQAECEFSLHTAGPAARIELAPGEKRLRADGRDICHLEFSIVDERGVRVPDATAEVTFTLEGPAKLLGIENGDLNSPATGKDGNREAYHGRGLAFLQSTREAGQVRVTARAKGLPEAVVEIESAR